MQFIIRNTEQGVILSERVYDMKSWHWGIIVALLIGYLVGVKFPATGASLLSKVGA